MLGSISAPHSSQMMYIILVADSECSKKEADGDIREEGHFISFQNIFMNQEEPRPLRVARDKFGDSCFWSPVGPTNLVTVAVGVLLG
jgi:hypothetical protein